MPIQVKTSILEGRTILITGADGHGVRLEVDLGILEAAYLHSICAAVSCVWPSDVFGRMLRSHDLLTEPLASTPPYLALPSGPGLGVELDEAAVAHHAVSRKEYA